MKRKTFHSTTTVGASSVEDCGVEPEDSYADRDQAQATPSLLVSSIKFSGVTAGSKIELTVQVLSDLYLETITLIRGGPAAATLGTLSKGTRKERGEASATISAELYDFVLSQARASTLLITLEHSETRVTNIRFESI
jgi:hypothetical protein